MKTSSPLLTTLLCAALAPLAMVLARADGDISNATITSADGLHLNLNDSPAFAGFQTTFNAGTPDSYNAGSIIPNTNTGAAITDANNVAQFSNLSGSQETDRYYPISPATNIYVSYSNANVSQFSLSAPTSQTNNPFFIGTDNLTQNETSVLMTPNEVYNFYLGLAGGNTDPDTQAFTPTVDSIAFTLTNAASEVVGSYSTTLTADSAGDPAFYDLQLDITGGDIGDTLTFTQHDANINLGHFSSSEGVYLDAITATPEPSTWALLSVGMAAVIGFRLRGIIRRRL